MAIAYAAPGVYREDVFINPQAQLPTGIVGFVGFAAAAADADPAEAAVPVPVSLDRPEEFAAHFAVPPGHLEAAVRGFFTNGGGRCYVMRADPKAMTADALISALEALEGVEDLDLIAVPDAMLL